MVGAPSETVDEIKQTIRFAKNLDIEEATFSITTPLPHTTLYEKTKHLIAKDITEFDYYKNPVYQPINGLDSKSITYWKRRALLEFYLHPKRIFSTMKLIGCWINYSIKIDKKIVQNYNTKIKYDLILLMKERKDIISKGIGTIFQEYGYFDSSFTTYQNGYWLYPSYLWGNQFQDKISKFYNSDLTIYEKYHEKLKKLKRN